MEISGNPALSVLSAAPGGNGKTFGFGTRLFSKPIAALSQPQLNRAPYGRRFSPGHPGQKKKEHLSVNVIKLIRNETPRDWGLVFLQIILEKGLTNQAKCAAFC